MQRPFLLGALLCVACSVNENTPVEAAGGPDEISGATQRPVRQSLPATAEGAARAVTRFGFDLYHRVAATQPAESGLVFAPHSIALALAMTREGARGETAEELDHAFHFPGDLAAAQEALRLALEPGLVPDYSARERRDVPAYQLSVACGMWIQEDAAFEGPFLEVLSTRYAAPATPVDYAQSAAVRDAINAWIEAHTAGRIVDLVPPGLPTRDAVLTLASAIHFEAAWEHAFSEQGTEPGPFTAPGREVEANFMRRLETFPYHDDERLQVVELPYRGGETSMVVMLPRPGVALSEIETQLDAEVFEALLASAQMQRVDVRLPRFEVRQKLSLAERLQELGVRLAFDSSAADFSGMSREERLFVSAALHEAFVRVDEKGTEAAAATVVMMSRTSLPVGEPKTFAADRPFLFAIRHRATGAVLFLGRVTDPS